LGYSEIDTGNADSYNFESTQISIKEDKMEYVDVIKSDLSPKFIVSEDVISLGDTHLYDAVITISLK